MPEPEALGAQEVQAHEVTPTGPFVNDAPELPPAPLRAMDVHALAPSFRHANGYLLYYGHIKRGSARVQVGDTVTTGQALATVASSGCSTNQHLHFEVRDCLNRPVDTMRRTSTASVQGMPNDPWTNAPDYYGPAGVLAIRVTNDDSFPSGWDIHELRNDVDVLKPGSRLNVGIGLSALGSNINNVGVPAPSRGADTLSFVIKRPDGTVFSGPPPGAPAAAAAIATSS